VQEELVFPEQREEDARSNSSSSRHSSFSGEQRGFVSYQDEKTLYEFRQQSPNSVTLLQRSPVQWAMDGKKGLRSASADCGSGAFFGPSFDLSSVTQRTTTIASDNDLQWIGDLSAQHHREVGAVHASYCTSDADLYQTSLATYDPWTLTFYDP
jgi:hypothetical protein